MADFLQRNWIGIFFIVAMLGMHLGGHRHGGTGGGHGGLMGGCGAGHGSHGGAGHTSGHGRPSETQSQEARTPGAPQPPRQPDPTRDGAPDPTRDAAPAADPAWWGTDPEDETSHRTRHHHA